MSPLRRMSRLARPRRAPRTPDAWLAEMTGRGVVPGAPDSGTPNSRAEAMPVLGGIVDGELLALVLSRCVLITRGGRLGDRAILDAHRVTWLGTPPPGAGDGRVAVSEPGGVRLRRPSDPMQRGRTAPQLPDSSGLLARTVPKARGGRIVEAVVSPWVWALLLDDGTVVAATNRGEADSITISADGSVALACDAPVVVDRAGGSVDLLELRSLPLGPVLT